MQIFTTETHNDVEYLAIDGTLTDICFDESEAAELHARNTSIWQSYLLRTVKGERLVRLQGWLANAKRDATVKAVPL